MNLQNVRRDTWTGSPQMESKIRLTHEPTGIMVEMNAYPIRYKNEKMAWELLEELVKAKESEKCLTGQSKSGCG